MSFGREQGIATKHLPFPDSKEFSWELLRVLQTESIDYVYVFFTRLLRGPLLDTYAGRLINFHPSLLPACPGLHGFEDTIESGALLAGSTVHFVDAGIDTGEKIMQTFTPTHQRSTDAVRHDVFAQQCAALMDTHLRLENGLPLLPKDRPARAIDSGFVPGVEAIALNLYRTILERGPPARNA